MFDNETLEHGIPAGAPAPSSILDLITEMNRRHQIAIAALKYLERREREFLTEQEQGWLRKRTALYEAADDYALRGLPTTAQEKFAIIDGWREEQEKLDSCWSELYDQIKSMRPTTFAEAAALLRELDDYGQEAITNVAAFLDRLASEPGCGRLESVHNAAE
jgi:hypothetical protein